MHTPPTLTSLRFRPAASIFSNTDPTPGLVPGNHCWRWLPFLATLLALPLAMATSAAGQEASPIGELPTEENFHLFVLAGQSNMAGRGEVEDIDRQVDPRVLALNAEGDWVPAVDPLHWDKSSAGVGLAKTFAIQYADHHPGVTVGLIPCAHGGSSIDAWEPGAHFPQTNSHPYDDTLARVQSVAEQGTLTAILWHQGESDCHPERVAGYEAKLARLFDRLRAEFSAPELPVVIGQLASFGERPWDAAKQKIDAAHQRLAEKLHRTDFVSSVGLAHRGDKIHFDSASYRELGRRYFAAYQRIAHQAQQGPALRSVQRIWDQSPHSAFTDLIRFEDRWYCAFREGQGHVSRDGAIRILRSDDALQWDSAARITSDSEDLRDAKLSISPAGELLLLAAGAAPPEADYRHQTYAWTSRDGQQWSDAVPVGEPDFWLWRTVWHPAQGGFAVGYSTGRDMPRTTRLYRSQDGKTFETLVADFFSQGYANESDAVFLPDDTCYLLLRRDPQANQAATAMLGRAVPPYTDWDWQDTGVRVGGPALIMADAGRMIAAVRLYDGHPRTSLCWVDPGQGKLKEFLRLPSGGDTSYAGLVLDDGRLWVSYYSSHEAPGNRFRSAIYLAQVKLN